MATEQFQAPLHCPACGQEGSATWEEGRLPTGGVRSPAKLLTLSGGFSSAREGLLRDIPKIICDSCETTLPD